jgi:AraC-like DNA-binding protein
MTLRGGGPEADSVSESSATGAPRGGVPGIAIDVLFESPVLRLTKWTCLARRPEVSPERRQGWHDLAFPAGRPFLIHRCGRSVVLERNSIFLRNANSPYRTSHPFGCGDSGHSLVLRDDILLDIVAHYDPSVREHPDSPFQEGTIPRFPRIHLLQEVLALHASGEHEPMAVEEAGVVLADEVIRSSHENRLAFPRRKRAAENVERAKALLSTRLRESLSLVDLLGSGNGSLSHLSRLFRHSTGMTLHRYRVRSRLHASIAKLLEPKGDLLEIALGLGFSSHSHFTAAFRAEFGMTPSLLQRLAATAGVPEIFMRLAG